MTGSATNPVRLAAVALAASLAHPVAIAQRDTTSGLGEQEQAQIESRSAAASHGGKAQLLPPQSVAEGADPLNHQVAAETVDGLVLAVTIDGASVTLASAMPARIPHRMARPDRVTGGDTVKATAFARGQVVATTIVLDNVLNASEGEGLVRTTRRQIALVIATDCPIDTVTVEAPVTGANASLDVRDAYARICDANPSSKWCPRRGQ